MREKVYTKLSDELYQKVLNHKEVNGLTPTTRAIRHIIFANDIEPVEDYTYSASASKTIMITIESPNLERLKELCEKYGKLKARMVRELLSGYFNKNAKEI